MTKSVAADLNIMTNPRCPQIPTKVDERRILSMIYIFMWSAPGLQM